MNNTKVWDDCLSQLKKEIAAEEINAWIMPLHSECDESTLKLMAPNRYVLNYVKLNLFDKIEQTALSMNHGVNAVQFEIGGFNLESQNSFTMPAAKPQKISASSAPAPALISNLNPEFSFETHVEGKSNQLARAASMHVGNGAEKSYNPLFIYGGVGLGKTHLMQASGNQIIKNNPKARVIYVRSELFVNDLIRALKENSMNEFKRYYRSLDALLIDDIQFFARKTVSQEEFFHTFNSLLEGQRQIIMTSDRIPKAINHIDDRLISRFGSGLTIAIEPPELETRVAILQTKAFKLNIDLPDDVAFFIANVIRSNVRELEGALHRIQAGATFTGRKISTELAREALRDLLVYQQKQISIDNIQQIVAEYFKIRVSDLHSKKRSRDIARPRQFAMAFAKEYTNLSLPKIGDHFGGRDHTTVLHACRKIEELRQSDTKVSEDFRNLRSLFGG